MNRIVLIGEDGLCVALGSRLIDAYLPGWQLAQEPIDTKGVTKLTRELPRYAEQARHVQPVLCVADTDGQCVVQWLRAWLPSHANERLLLRLAVTEAESWLLADRTAFAEHFAVPLNKLPQHPDEEPDPKGLILTLVKRSKTRLFREEMVAADDPSKKGSGYNIHLAHFVRHQWQAHRASAHSPSLSRAVKRIAALAVTPA